MRSRQLHALVTLLPAVVLTAAAAVVVGVLIHTAAAEGLTAPRAVLAATFAWPTTIAAVSLLVRALRGLAGALRCDPIRTLRITPIGHAWRIPLRRRHPISTAALAVAASGGAMAAVLATGVVGAPDVFLLAASIGGSLVLGLGAFALISVLDRHQDRSLVLDPHAGELIVPPLAGRTHVVRIGLGRVHEITSEPHGPLGLMHRTTIVFDDDQLGPGVRLPLLARVDPARAQDLAAWILGAVRSVQGPVAPARVALIPPVAGDPPMAAGLAERMPAGPGLVAGQSAAAPSTAANASGMIPADAPPMPPLGRPGAPPAEMPAARAPRGAAFPGPARRRRTAGQGLVGLVGRMNMPVVLSAVGLLCVAGALATGLRITPRTSEAAVGPSTVHLIGRTLDGEPVHASDPGVQWTWVVDVAPGQNTSDQQLETVRRLLPRWTNGVRFRVNLVSGERAGDPVDARLGRRVAKSSGLPESVILLQRDHGSAVPRHRLIDAEGRVAHEAVGFHAASTIEKLIDLRRLAVQLDVGGPSDAGATPAAATVSLEESP